MEAESQCLGSPGWRPQSRQCGSGLRQCGPESQLEWSGMKTVENRGAWCAADHGLRVNPDSETEQQLIKKHHPRHMFNQISGTPRG